MKRVFTLCLVTIVALGSRAPSQDPVGSRRLKPAPGIQDHVNDVFGALLSWCSFVPFYNVGPWIGLSDEPHLLLDGAGNPTLRRTELRGHTGAVRDVQLSPAADLALTIGADRTARLWNLRGLQVALLDDHESDITAAAFFPDGGEVATGTADGTLRLWKVHPAGHDPRVELTATVAASPGPIRRIHYTADGAILATAGDANSVTLWNAQCQPNVVLQGHTGAITALTSSPDSATLLTGSADGTARTWDATGRALAELPGHAAAVVIAEFSSDGQWILTAADGDPAVRVWRRTGEAAAVIEVGDRAASARWVDVDGAPQIAVDSTTERQRFGTDGSDLGSQTIPGWSLARVSDQVELRRDGTVVHRLAAGDDTAFSADGTRILTIATDGAAVIWDWLVRDPTGAVVITNVPLVVLWLIVAAVFFTVFMRFVNLRMFRHAIRVVAGHYDDPNDEGEVTHFQALSSALSGTVGLGNIAGVAIAIMVGGPGATVWMIVAGLLGMTLKFTECTLGQRYRQIDANGRISGGPMHYLKDGLTRRGLGGLGSALAGLFTLFCIGGSLAGGNSFQVNQSLTILRERVPFFTDNGWIYGVFMAVMVGIVIIGGIRRIAHTAEAIVPTMCGVYLLASLTILLFNIDLVPGALATIFDGAFNGDAVYGGALGALIMGFRRAAFSNEAGVGSAAIAHSAAKTPYPVREGIVSLLEPFIDTVVVCTMTAVVINITGVHTMAEHADLVAGKQGAALTSEAFQTVSFLASWFPWVLMLAVVMFAFSTMITWSYYGERCWTHLFGPRSSLLYKGVFLVFVVLGSVVTATNMLEFGDLMILLMAFPNILGLYFLGGEVRGELADYEQKLGAGELPIYK